MGKKIGFVGMGNMAIAMAKRMISSKKVNASDLLAFAPNKDKLKKNADETGFTPVYSVKELIASSDIVIIACKPYQIEKALEDVKEDLFGKTVVSVAAGWNFEKYDTFFGGKTHVLCVMPNTPVMTGEGVILFEEKNSLEKDMFDAVYDVFSSLGQIFVINGDLMRIGGAISGCGPAFFDVIMESYADAAVKYGIPRELAYKLVSQTMIGSAKLQQETGKHPGELKDAVCSPLGTTIKGVEALERGGIRTACKDSINVIMS